MASSTGGLYKSYGNGSLYDQLKEEFRGCWMVRFGKGFDEED